jgi:hypothetical protein
MMKHSAMRKRAGMTTVRAVALLGVLLGAWGVCAEATAQPSPPPPPATHEPPASSGAAEDVITLGSAERALAAGDVPGAIKVHEALLAAHGPQPDLYYNLGILYGNNEDWPQAVLSLERARTLDPDAADVRAHLTRAKEALSKGVLAAYPDRQITQGEPRSFAMWRFFHTLSPTTAGALLLVGVMVGFGALTARRFVKHSAWRDGVMVVGVLGLLVGGVTGAYAVGQAQTRDVRPAMVMRDAPKLFNAPMLRASTETHPDLYRGVMVQVLEERDGWRRVALPDGTEGWLPVEDVADIRIDRWKP